jgi:hypothetical protein
MTVSIMRELFATIFTALVTVVMVFALAGLVSFISGLVFMLCWNYVAAGVFHAPALDFWHAYVGTMLLCTIGGAFRTKVELKKE